MSALSISTLEIASDEPVRSPEINGLMENFTNGHDQTPENELAESIDESLPNGVENGIENELEKTLENGYSLGFNEDITKENLELNEHNHFNEYCPKYNNLKVNKIEYSKSDINHNGEVKKCEENCPEEDSDNEKSESKSEVTLCASPMVVNVCRNAKSNETSTDTLVAENGVISR